jgi:hypothetical protein
VLVLTNISLGAPHVWALQHSNPMARVHVITSTAPLGTHGWRNNDALAREWWRNNREKIKCQRVAWLEWDVLVTGSFPDVHPAGLLGREIKSENRYWGWWAERPRLPECEGHYVGVVPLAVCFWNAAALDAIAHPRYDEAYQRDIFCELRTPSVCKASGFPVEQIHLPHVRCYPVRVRSEPGIYHAVKTVQS